MAGLSGGGGGGAGSGIKAGRAFVEMSLNSSALHRGFRAVEARARAADHATLLMSFPDRNRHVHMPIWFRAGK